MTVEKWDQLLALPCWEADLAKDWAKIRLLETDLDVKPFPISQAGLDAYNLWNLIKQRLLRGLSLELTPTELKLAWHRQKLKRARGVLVDMELVRPIESGRYVIGRYSRVDEIIREDLLSVHVVREVLLIVGGLMPKSKIQKETRSNPRHNGEAGVPVAEDPDA